MFNLPDDILLKIYLILNIKDLVSFSCINKFCYKIINDNIYWEWGKNKYSLEFWQKAQNRSIQISKPLITMKAELKRIHLFQYSLKLKGHQEWNNNDFYIYWYGCEKNNSKK